MASPQPNTAVLIVAITSPIERAGQQCVVKCLSKLAT